MIALLYSVITADFIMPETQQPIIVIILIIHSPYLLKDLVERNHRDDPTGHNNIHIIFSVTSLCIVTRM